MAHHVASLTTIVSNQQDFWMSGLDACLSGFLEGKLHNKLLANECAVTTTQKLTHLAAIGAEEGRAT